MSGELYHRFTEVYLPGQSNIKDNELFSKVVNSQISLFIDKNKVSSYRIVNCETQVLPPSTNLKVSSYGYVMLIVHIAYLV